MLIRLTGHFKLLYLIFFLLVSINFCNAKNWEYLSDVRVEKNKLLLLDFNKSSIPFDIQIRIKDKIVSSYRTTKNQSLVHSILLKTYNYDNMLSVYIRFIYETKVDPIINFSSRELTDINLIQTYSTLSIVSKLLFKVKDKREILHNIKSHFNDVTHTINSSLFIVDLKLAWFLFELEEYGYLTKVINRMKNDYTNETSRNKSFYWLCALSLLNTGSFLKASNKFKYTINFYEKYSEKTVLDESNLNEIKALYGFSKSLSEMYASIKITNIGMNYISKALESVIKKGNYQLISRILYLQSANNTILKKYQNSIDDLNQALIYIKKSGSDVGKYLVYNQMAINYLYMNNIVSTQYYYRKVIKYLDMNFQQYTKAGIYRNLAETYVTLGDYSRAYRYFELSFGIYEKVGSIYEKNIVSLTLGTIDRINQDFEKSITKHVNNIDYFKNKSIKLLIDSLNELSVDYYKIDKIDKSKITAMHALFLIINDRLNHDKNIDTETILSYTQKELEKHLDFRVIKIKSLGGFRSILQLATLELHKGINNQLKLLINLLDNGFNKLSPTLLDQLNYYELKINYLSKMKNYIELDYLITNFMRLVFNTRNKFDVSDLALFWTNQSNRILDGYINALIDQKRFKDVFQLLERFYAVNLKENRKKHLMKTQFDDENTELNLTQYLKLERESLLIKDSDLLSLADEAKEKYLGMQIKQSREIIDDEPYDNLSLNFLQKHLNEKELFLRYYINEENSILYVIDKNSFKIKILPTKDKLIKLTRDYLDSIYSKKYTKIINKKEFANLILPLDQIILNKYKKLIIIPDGIINLIPIDSIDISKEQGKYIPLMTNIVSERVYSIFGYFKNLNKMISTKTISIFANPVFFENLGNSIIKKKIHYGSKLRDFKSLPGTDREAQNIVDLFHNFEINLMLKENATNNNFLNIRNRNSTIVHIATHGFFSENNIENIGLASSVIDSDNNMAPGIITMREILTYPFKANLVVVSGCETTRGKEINGEGFNSLSRGFLSLGVNSVIGSIWAISDQATEKFMKIFYSELISSNFNVALALNSTKRQFIKKHKRYNHPYYWAGFVLTTSNRDVSRKILN